MPQKPRPVPTDHGVGLASLTTTMMTISIRFDDTVQGFGGFTYRVCRHCRYEQTHCRCEVNMTAEEHDHMQELEGLVKRYRSRIVALKEEPRIVPGEVFDAELLWANESIRVRVTDIRHDEDGSKVLVLEQTERTGGSRTRPLGPEAKAEDATGGGE